MSNANGSAPTPRPGYKGGFSPEARKFMRDRTAMFLQMTQGTGKPMVYGTGKPPEPAKKKARGQ